jgi:hypothetical protein
MTVELSSSQCENLADFIEIWLFEDIRSDPDLDSMAYLKDMVDAYYTLRNAHKK